MLLLHNIKPGPTSNYNTREEVEEHLRLFPTEIITFDGVYESVYENRDLFMGRRCIMFIIGDYVGFNNSFDEGQPLEKFCNWWQLLELEAQGMEWGWHTWGHPDLTNIGSSNLEYQVKPPFPMKHFAYPYGKYFSNTTREVERAGFAFGYTTNAGSRYDRHAIPRRHIPK